MTSPNSSYFWRGTVACASLAVAACATSAPPPTVQMTMARGAVATANTSGAQAYAPQDLRLANDKLALAEKAMADKSYAVALRNAEQAQSDAQLATSKTQSAKARNAVAAAQADQRMQGDAADANARRVAPGATQ